jgi:hypothetical protein
VTSALAAEFLVPKKFYSSGPWWLYLEDGAPHGFPVFLDQCYWGPVYFLMGPGANVIKLFTAEFYGFSS